ncbi:hypothetical protein [Parafrankia sp. FMc2]|uniref:hypothetical protein n=1 Tax=Parafrankia sp. FMc2 TaxID=3233196 RepID=UPI0034D7A80C
MPPRTRHPAHAILRTRGISQRTLAADLGYCEQTVSTALSGGPTTAPFRRKVSEYLGLPEGDLFHDAAVEWEAQVLRVINTAPVGARHRAARLAAAFGDAA